MDLSHEVHLSNHAIETRALGPEQRAAVLQTDFHGDPEAYVQKRFR